MNRRVKDTSCQTHDSPKSGLLIPNAGLGSRPTSSPAALHRQSGT